MFYAEGLFSDSKSERREDRILFLKEYKSQITDQLNQIASEMKIEAHKISRVIDDKEKVRALLNDFTMMHPYIAACGLVNFEGYFEVLEPEKFRKYEGLAIRSQEHI